MINTLTLNPAIDHIFYLDRFRRNITNRLTDTAVSIGGKGTHVSVNLAIMGTPSRAFGFTFGQTGRRILQMLDEAGAEAEIEVDGGVNAENGKVLAQAGASVLVTGTALFKAPDARAFVEAMKK